MKPLKHTLVAGLGNPLMGDEGIGVVLVEQLANLVKIRGFSGYDEIEFYDAGVGGLSLLYKMEQRTKVVLIDCAKMGEEPGSIRRFTPDEVRTIKKLEHFSLHEMDLLKLLELAEQLGTAPREVILFGIEPEKIEFSCVMSPKINQMIPHYLDDIIRELQ